MLRRSCLAGLFVVLALMFTLTGCSDNSTGNNKIIGDPNSASFQNMKAAIAASIDSTLSVALRFGKNPYKVAPMDTIDIRPDWGVLNPNDTLLYNYSDGWNIVYLGLTTGTEYNHVWVDSARFFVEYGRMDADFSYHVQQMDFIHHQTSTYKGVENDYQNASIYLNVDFNSYSFNGGTLVGMGQFVLDDYYQTNSGSAHDKYTFAANLDNVVYKQPINDPYTTAYTLSGSITFTVTVMKGEISNSWTVTANFDVSGNIQVTANTGNTEYSYQTAPHLR